MSSWIFIRRPGAATPGTCAPRQCYSAASLRNRVNCRRASGGFPAQGLAHAMNAAARAGEHGHVRIIDLEARRPELAIEVLGGERRQHPVASERHDVASERHGLPEARRNDLDALRLEPGDDVV